MAQQNSVWVLHAELHEADLTVYVPLLMKTRLDTLKQMCLWNLFFLNAPKIIYYCRVLNLEEPFKFYFLEEEFFMEVGLLLISVAGHDGLGYFKT